MFIQKNTSQFLMGHLNMGISKSITDQLLFLYVFHPLTNCIWDQFSLFQRVTGFVLPTGRRLELPAMKAQPCGWASVWAASMSAALTPCLACTLALRMWSTLSATFLYKCGLCPRTLARTSACHTPASQTTAWLYPTRGRNRSGYCKCKRVRLRTATIVHRRI